MRKPRPRGFRALLGLLILAPCTEESPVVMLLSRSRCCVQRSAPSTLDPEKPWGGHRNGEQRPSDCFNVDSLIQLPGKKPAWCRPRRGTSSFYSICRGGLSTHAKEEGGKDTNTQNPPQWENEPMKNPRLGGARFMRISPMVKTLSTNYRIVMPAAWSSLTFTCKRLMISSSGAVPRVRVGF